MRPFDAWRVPNTTPTWVRSPSSGSVAALSGPASVTQNTTFTNDLSEDGLNWAQSRPSITDKNGNLVELVQRYNGATKQMNFVYSNNSGASWTDAGIAEGAIVRGAMAYDPAQNCLHVAYIGSAATDGIFYRRYTISYTSTSISGIARTDVVSMVVDGQTTGTMTYEHPVVLFCNDATMFNGSATNGTLVIVWSAYNAGSGWELRSAARVLSYTSADGTAANWRSISGGASPTGSTTIIGNAPATATYFRLGGAVDETAVGWFAAERKTWASGNGQGSITYFGCRAGAATNGGWYRGRLDFTAAGGWTVQAGPTFVEALKRSGTDSGYAFKYQLVSKVAMDATNDRAYVTYTVWGGDAAGLGDTVVLRAYSFATDAWSSAVDVFSAGSAQTDVARDMFVTNDVGYDATANLVLVSYTDLPRHDVYLKTYTPAATPVLSQSAFTAYTATPCDIPCIHPDRVGGKVALFFRDFNVGARSNPPTYTPPYHGYLVTMTLA